jgi:hypothetical protein
MSRHANPRTPLWNPATIAPEPPALILKIDDEATTRQIGDVRRWDGSAWATAEPTDARTDTMGVVVVVNADSYLLALWGLTWIDPLELTLDPHTDYWLDVGGVLTTTKPASAGILILRHYENGFVVVRSGSGGVSVLDDLDDVDAATPDDGQALGWDATAARWVPLDAPDIAGGNKVKGDAADPFAGYLGSKIDGATIEYDGATYAIRVKDGGITPAKLANLAANSVLGRSAGTAGVPGAITATADKVLMMRSGIVGFYNINNANISPGVITGDRLVGRTLTFAEIALGTITDAEISATAAIGWDKIDKTGAVAGDVGAQPESADLDSLAGASAIGWVRHSAADSYAIYPTIPWGDIDTKPTTLAGYGITDACTLYDARLSDNRTPLDGSVITAKLATDSVTTIKIAAGAITAAKIGAGQVGGTQIANGAVGASQLATGSIGPSHFQAVSGPAFLARLSATGSGDPAWSAIGFGTIVRRKASGDAAAAPDVELGTTGSGGGSLKVFHTASKYVEIKTGAVPFLSYVDANTETAIKDTGTIINKRGGDSFSVCDVKEITTSTTAPTGSGVKGQMHVIY